MVCCCAEDKGIYRPPVVRGGTLAVFVKNDVVDDLRSVPGIGDISGRRLAGAGILTTYQLIGKFLMGKSLGLSQQDHCNAFYRFLLSVGFFPIYASRVVQAIGMKADSIFPGVYDEDVLTAPSGGCPAPC